MKIISVMPGNEEIIIEAKGLAKRFAEVQAVSGVDFTVSRGELFGFLGPNGAGNIKRRWIA